MFGKAGKPARAPAPRRRSSWPVTPARPVTPVERAQPATSVERAQPANRAQPATPVERAQPANRTQPAKPTRPATRAQPAKPATAAEPARPVRAGPDRNTKAARSRVGESAAPTYVSSVNLRSIDGHLTRTATQVMAWYRLAPQAWSFRSDGQRELLIHQIAAQLGELQGHWLHLRVTTRPYPVHMWAEAFDHNALGRPPDVAGALGWDGFLEGEQRHLMGLSMSDKEVFLGVEVSGRGALDRWVERAAPVLDKVVPGAARAELAALASEIRHIDALVAGTGLDAIPATSDDLGWLMYRSCSLGLPAPRTLSMAPGARWESEDLAAFTDGVELHQEPYAPTVKVVGRLRSQTVTRHVAVLSVGMMDGLRIPEVDDPWMQRSDRLPFPVEWSARMYIRRPEEVTGELQRQMGKVRSQIRHYTHDHDLDPPMSLARQADRVLEIEDELSGGLTNANTRLYGWWRIAVAGRDESEAISRAQQLLEVYRPKVSIEHPEAQYRYAREFIPGEPLASSAYRRRGSVTWAAAGVPAATAAVGDRRGIMLGETCTATRRPVAWDPWLAQEVRRASGLTAVVGGLGSGKALALDTPLPTPTGWTTMGEVGVGDELLGRDGKPTRVVAATEVMHGRPCYDVVFSDGSVIRADARHEWLTRTGVGAPRASRESGVLSAEGVTFSAHFGRFCDVFGTRSGHPPTGQRATEQLVAGQLATGQGSPAGQPTTGQPTTGQPTTGQLAAEQCSRTGQHGPTGALATVQRGRAGRHRFTEPRTTGPRTTGPRTTGPRTTAVHTTEEIAVSLLADDHRSHHGVPVAGPFRLPESELPVDPRLLGERPPESLPRVYLRAAAGQRRALLAGLLGARARHASGMYTAEGVRLAHDVRELMLSLGYQVGTVIGRTFAWSTNPYRDIVDVVAVDSVPVRCVQVDNADHLYLAGESCIPTHNSFLTGLIVYKTTRAGARWTVLDPSGPLAELTALPELAPFSRNINLLRADPGILNPYRVVAEPKLEHFVEDEDAERAWRRERSLAAATRRRLVLDVLTGLLPFDISRLPHTRIVLLRAVREVGGAPEGNPGQVIEVLRRHARDGEEHAGVVADFLAERRELPQAALLFPDETRDDPWHADRDYRLTVLTMQGMTLPRPGSPREEWTDGESLAVELLNLASWLTQRTIYDANRNLRKGVALDESHFLSQVPTGKVLIDRLARDSRKFNVRALFASQLAGDLLRVPGFASLVNAVFVGRTDDEQAQVEALRLLRVPIGVGYEQMLGTLSPRPRHDDRPDDTPRQFVFADGHGGVEKIRIDLEAPHLTHLAEALDTNPDAARVSAPSVPSSAIGVGAGPPLPGGASGGVPRDRPTGGALPSRAPSRAARADAATHASRASAAPPSAAPPSAARRAAVTDAANAARPLEGRRTPVVHGAESLDDEEIDLLDDLDEFDPEEVR